MIIRTLITTALPTALPSKSKDTVFILADSMVKKVNGFNLIKISNTNI